MICLGYQISVNNIELERERERERVMEIELKQVLHMKEGNGDTSYAKTSYIQKKVLLLTESIKVEAIRGFYSKQHPSTLCIADLGCSSSELNNMYVVFKLIATVEKARRQLGHGPLDYQVLLNDLPGNDFNTVFRSLPCFEKMLKQQVGDGFGHCFVYGVPGSFYGRLFPDKSLHFVHSSYSLHWLSQVPKGIENNKRNICIGRTSPVSVVKAYFDQFQKDLLMFLRCRSKEVAPEGIMVLTILGKKTSEPSCTEHSQYVHELLASVLNDMVNEGHIEEEKLHTFNLPLYLPSPTELGFLVDEDGSFTLTNVHVSEVHWTGKYSNQYDIGDSSDLSNKIFDEYDFAKCMRSVFEPLLIIHFGKSLIIDQVFERYRKAVHASMTNERNSFTSVTLSLSKRG